MSWSSAVRGGRSWVLRLLLVVALGTGLCAMHVLAAAVDRHHAVTHEATAPVGDGAVGASSSAASSSNHGTVTAGTSDHGDHHAMSDCVLFLGAGVALLVLLLAWTAARALRSSYLLLPGWRAASVRTTPWRGPPARHWPRISLCVVRI